MPSEDKQEFGSVFPFGESPLNPQNRNVHPWPTYAPIGDEIESNNYEFPERAGVTDAPPDVTLGPGETLTPTVALRQQTAAQPKIPRSPAILKYPKSRRTLFIDSGGDMDEVSLGFDCRAIQVQNVGTNVFLYCRELGIYLTTSPTPLATYNLPEMAERLSFEWHTAVFNPVTPAGVPGQGAVVWLFDEWVPPVSAAASSGGGGVAIVEIEPSTVGTPSDVAAAAADTLLLAANANRKGAVIVNDSATATLYVQLGAAASLTTYTAALSPIAGTIPGMYEVPFNFTGEIRGIWTAAVGNARITELT